PRLRKVMVGRLALAQPSGERTQRRVELRGAGAVRSVEVGVARGEGEAVAFPNGRTGDDLRRDAEIADELLHDQKLLVILLAEIGPIRQAGEQQLGDDGGDAGEEMRAEVGLQARRGTADQDPRVEALRIHLLRRWGEE